MSTPVTDKLVTVAGLKVAYDTLDRKPFLADAYDNTATYAVGDYCVYNGSMYKCNTAISVAESWTPAHWTATNVDNELKTKVDTSSIVNDLTSTATDKPGSANMLKTLNDKIMNKRSVVLFSGNSQSAISFSESANNFDFLIVEFMGAGGFQKGCMPILTFAATYFCEVTESSSVYAKGTIVVTDSGLTISTRDASGWSAFAVTKVIGVKIN